jgi:hypothetical protein
MHQSVEVYARSADRNLIPPRLNAKVTEHMTPATNRGLSTRLRDSITPTVVAVFLAGSLGFLIGLLIITCYSATIRSWEFLAGAAGLGTAASAVGSIAGFVFGIPRYNAVVSLRHERLRTLPDTDRSSLDEDDTLEARRIYSPSNNLEQVSDWLTKLLLGAGLVQLSNIGNALGALVDRSAKALVPQPTNPDAGKVVLGSTLLIFCITGFLFVYLTTTLWYRQQLERYERRAVGLEKTPRTAARYGQVTAPEHQDDPSAP